jgi:hypothetical protein
MEDDYFFGKWKLTNFFATWKRMILHNVNGFEFSFDDQNTTNFKL